MIVGSVWLVEETNEFGDGPSLRGVYASLEAALLHGLPHTTIHALGSDRYEYKEDGTCWYSVVKEKEVIS